LILGEFHDYRGREFYPAILSRLEVVHKALIINGTFTNGVYFFIPFLAMSLAELMLSAGTFSGRG
jgi:hypothetical protein